MSKQMVSLDEFWTISEVAKVLTIHYNTAFNLLQRNQIPTRWASREEELLLLDSGRLLSLPGKTPGQRIRLVMRTHIYTLQQTRRRRGERGKDKKPRALRLCSCTFPTILGDLNGYEETDIF